MPTARDIESGKTIEKEVPAYLYRGESIAYPTTTSTLHRLLNDDRLPLPTHVRSLIKEVADRLDEELQGLLELVPMLSEGFLQHYGAPTGFLDVTSSLDVAAFFASEGKVGCTGLMCILQVATVLSKSKIIDLTAHPKAERPRRQSAYAFSCNQYEDLKSQDCIEDLNLSWFSFTLRDSDVQHYRGNSMLLDAHTDRMAGVLQLIMDDLEKIDDLADSMVCRSSCASTIRHPC